MPRKKKETSQEETKVTKETKADRISSQSDAGGETKETRSKKPSAPEVLMGTGRRKTAVAGVWLKNGKGPMLVNDKPIGEYFPGEAAKKIYEEPLRIVNRLDQFSATIKLTGGGTSAQLGAVVHGLARALASYDTSFKEILSKKKFLTRDSRMKERRKAGHAGKARKRKQSPKR